MPTSVTRATGMSFGYNLGTSIFGGFTPVVVAWLIATTGNKLMPGFYLTIAAVLSLGTLLILRSRYGVK